MVFDATLLNIQHYKVCIKGKVEQSREKSHALYLHLGVVAIEKGAFRLPTLIFILNKPELICLLTVKWFQVFLCNTNNSI